jgi:hypothetical protein
MPTWRSSGGTAVPPVAGLGDDPIAERDPALVRTLKPCNQTQRCCLAAPGWAEEGENFPARNGE